MSQINTVIIYIIAVFFLVGIMCFAPLLGNILTPVISPVYDLIGADPANFPGIILGPDGGAFALSESMTEDTMVIALDQIKMVNISGTYIDAPYHRFEDGYKIGDIPLEKLIDLAAYVIHLDARKGCFDIDDFQKLADEDLEGAAVLCHSGHELSHLSVICEDMINLGQLPDKGARLYVVPIRVAMASFPARVFAIVDEDHDSTSL